jgi:hypothetical protein
MYKPRESNLISGFRRDVDEICGLLGYYTPCNNPEDHRFQENQLWEHKMKGVSGDYIYHI